MRPDDEKYMDMALTLALRGTGAVSPNPLVGCVLVRNGAVIGSGWHMRCGEAHAEVYAVRDAGGDAAGATAYVNLEPCSHFGRTPPCADLLIEKGVVRVVVGLQDPNPKVNGKGIEKLLAAGIEVETGVLEDRCRFINRGFIMKEKHGRPWVQLKVASSLDGKVALGDGSSKWITGAESRRKVHGMRARHDALITGVGTVLADDPEMTVRDAPGRTPLRVVLDPDLSIPEDARILDLSNGETMIITAHSAPLDKVEGLRRRGVEVVLLPTSGQVEIMAVLALLGAKGVNYLMVEAGPRVVGSFLGSGLVDGLSLFVAPKIMGNGRCWTDGVSIGSMAEAPQLKQTRVERFGEDFLLEGVFECSPDL